MGQTPTRLFFGWRGGRGGGGGRGWGRDEICTHGFSFAPAEGKGQIHAGDFCMSRACTFTMHSANCSQPCKHQTQNKRGEFHMKSFKRLLGISCLAAVINPSNHTLPNAFPCQCQQLVCWVEWLCKSSLLCFDWVQVNGGVCWHCFKPSLFSANLELWKCTFQRNDNTVFSTVSNTFTWKSSLMLYQCMTFRWLCCLFPNNRSVKNSTKQQLVACVSNQQPNQRYLSKNQKQMKCGMWFVCQIGNTMLALGAASSMIFVPKKKKG